jgi:hypothetical protein
MIYNTLEHASNKYTLMASVWKVFSILLEYCCKSNYKMMIQKIINENLEKLDKLERSLME